MAAERPEQISKLISTGSRLRLDAGAAAVLISFERAGVRALLLKGPAVASWLYGGGEARTYQDVDLLIAPDDLEAAEEALRSLSYARTFDDRGMPSWWREHANTWVRDGSGLTVDLHRTLVGVGTDLATTWRLLSAESAVVVVAGHPAPALALPARALHVALHAAQHGIGASSTIADLERALTTADDELWRQAAALAAELEATDAFGAGLRLAPGGAELASRLELPPARSVDAQLRATTPPPVALGFEQLARAEGLRARMEIVGRKLLPPAEFIREWDPRAAESRSALLWAYGRRPLWLLRRVPRGLSAWLQARRAVRRLP